MAKIKKEYLEDYISPSTLTELDKKISKTTSPTVVNGIWSGTQAQYDAIATKDATIIYFIV